jgi:hypothetical protein
VRGIGEQEPNATQHTEGGQHLESHSTFEIPVTIWNDNVVKIEFSEY